MGLLLLAFAFVLIFHDLTNSNRPHELHNAPWVVLILAMSTVLSVRVVVLSGGPKHRPVLFSFGLTLLLVDLLVLVPAVSTAWTVLTA